jgi:hypothetical protein
VAAIAVGDVLRLRMVGQVTAVVPNVSVTLRTASGTDVVFPWAIRDDTGFAWETQPAPEPAYEAGALYADAAQAVFQRTAMTSPGDRWRVLVHPSLMVGGYVGEFVPVRPLTRLIPAGGPGS